MPPKKVYNWAKSRQPTFLAVFQEPSGEIAPMVASPEATLNSTDNRGRGFGLPRRRFWRATLFGLVGSAVILVTVVGSAFLSRAVQSRGADRPEVLVGAGDITRCDHLKGAEEVANLLATIPGTIFTAGDDSNDSGKPEEYANCFGPTWGRFLSRIHPAAGNHDYTTPGAPAYYAYFGKAAGDPDKGYYSYNLGTWHIVVLNSNCKQIGGCGAGSPEEQWLRADLSAHKAACTLAYWHHPLFSSGQHGDLPDTQAFWQALYVFGADIVVNGHDHDYERFAPQDPNGNLDPTHGIREFVAGTGGAGARVWAPRPHANSQIYNDKTLGVLKFTLHPGSYDWEFVPVAGKTFTDSGSESCR